MVWRQRSVQQREPLAATFWLILGGALVSGCGTVHKGYDGPERSAFELALVNVAPQSSCQMVDGVKVYSKVTQFQLLPGSHSFNCSKTVHSEARGTGVTYYYVDDIVLSAALLAGRSYEINSVSLKKSEKEYSIKYWLKDTANGRELAVTEIRAK